MATPIDVDDDTKPKRRIVIDTNNPKLKQHIPIDDTIDLSAFGYPKGSQACIIVNPTKTWAKTWWETFEVGTVAEAEPLRYALVPHVIKHVTLVDWGNKRREYPLETPEQVQAFDMEADHRLLNSILQEMWERGNEGILNGHRSFRSSRGKRDTSAG
jgi:hypothetical protein